MVFTSPVGGCYYGVLNVLDPSVHYDADGKVVGVLKLPPAEPRGHGGMTHRHQQQHPQQQQMHQQQQQPQMHQPQMHQHQHHQLQQNQHNVSSPRNETQDFRRDSSEFREVQEIIVVETVESTQSPPDQEPPIIRESSVDILDVTAVEDPGPDFQVLKKVDTFPEDAGYNARRPVPQPMQEPIPLFDAEEMTEPSVKTIPEPTDAAVENAIGPGTGEALAGTPEQNTEGPTESRNEETVEAAVEDREQLPEEVAPTKEPAEDMVQEEPATEPNADANTETEAERNTESTAEANTEAAVNTSTEQSSDKPVEIEEDDGVVEEPAMGSGANPAFVPLSQYQAPTTQTGATVTPPPATGQGTRAVTEPAPIFVDDQSLVQVVDYREATPLFRAVSQKNWQGILYYLRTGSFSFSPLSSGNKSAITKQAQTWVSKRDVNGNELWRQLPLHAAICFGAPMKVIEKLLEANRDALKSPDCYGNLPLHLAFIFDASDHVTAYLMKAFPASIHVMNFEGLQPIQCSKEISSEIFQSNAELFGALSDYTRAVAENDPEKLIEQLHDVKTQLKAVNDTLFAQAPPRKPELIKEVFSPEAVKQQTAIVADYGPGAFMREMAVAAGICSVAPLEEDEVPSEAVASARRSFPPRTLTEVEKPHRQEVVVLQDVPTSYELPPSSPQHQTCRVMEYCPKTKSWKEV
ncbi:expressed unknown protein [Seminavis robusta]|uniref:Uncharacterized protein n=1 Tax=Seminavis robusta TaxID=568900 RepID=A0A9N8DQQ7_9STRA|nr:expressed unknown protein [Seminavis robusta]|eukprot:Sro215_g089060.1 n/a (691) ;mRNA; r:46945-49017